MKIAFIIPARSGSKRIPNKNIKKIDGKPIIAHVIQEIKKTKFSKHIYVNTNSIKIAKIAKKYGVEVPFLRSKNLSGDNVPIFSVIKDTIFKLKKIKLEFDLIFIIYPTSIFIKKKIIYKIIKEFKKNKSLDYFLAVKKYEHPIARAYKIKDNFLKIKNQKMFFKRTQDLETNYFDSGQIFAGKTQNFLKKKKFNKSKIGFLKLNLLDSIDIDFPEDWVMAKKLYKLLKNEKK